MPSYVNSRTEGESEDEDVFQSGPADVTLTDSSTELRSNMAALLKSEKLTDFEVICRGQCYHVHRIILILGSIVFKDLLLPQTDDIYNVSGQVEFDSDPGLVEMCIEYMYAGAVTVPLAKLQQLADVAELLGVVSLRDQCLKTLYNNIVIVKDNCLHLWALGVQIGYKPMYRAARDVAFQSFPQLVNDESFCQLPCVLLEEYLTNSKLTTVNPDELLTAAITWCRYEGRSRQHFMPKLLKALPLRSMSQLVLKQILKEPLVQKCSECQDLIRAVLTNPETPTPTKIEPPLTHRPAFKPRPPQPTKSSAFVFAGMQRKIADVFDAATNEVSVLASTVDTPCNKLATIPVPPPAHGRVACCASGNSLFVSGLGERCDEVWRLQVNFNKWNMHSKLCHGRVGHCMAVSGARLYVLGGSSPDSCMTLSRNVEMLVVISKKWNVVGVLKGSVCCACCCCCLGDDILVYGVIEEGIYVNQDNMLLQVFSTAGHKTTHSVVTPSGSGGAYGLIVAGDKIVMFDNDNTVVSPVTSLYSDDSSSLVTIPLYLTPNRLCVIGLSADTQTIVALGGDPRPEMRSHSVYTASLSDLVENTGPGWRPLKKQLNIHTCCICPGACITMSISL